MTTFLFKHPKIKGNCDFKGYETCVEIDAFGLDVSRSSQMPVGNGGSRSLGAVAVSHVQINKKCDVSSGAILNELLTPAPVDCDVIVLQSADSNMQEIMRVTLTEALITSFNMSANHGITESFRISYTKILNSYTPLAEDNKPKSSFKVGFDLTTAKKI